MKVTQEHRLSCQIMEKIDSMKKGEMKKKVRIYGLKWPQKDEDHDHFIIRVLVGMLMQKSVIERRDRLFFKKMTEDSELYKLLPKINTPDLGNCQFDKVKWTLVEDQIEQLLHYGMLTKPLLYTYNEGDRFLVGGEEENEFRNETLAMDFDYLAKSCVFLPGCWKAESIHRLSPKCHAEPRSYVTYADGYIPYWKFTPRRKMFDVVKASTGDKTMKWRDFNWSIYAPAKSLYFPTPIRISDGKNPSGS